MIVCRYTTSRSVRESTLQYARDLDARTLGRIAARTGLPAVTASRLLAAGVTLHTPGGFYVLDDAAERARRVA